ncbi:MAG: GH3 auxin-responsive promoter family protein [Planctomycetota bacterium]|nr:GH3 auxin-responsive promoter family protein [Planctomycetota bacterium]
MLTTLLNTAWMWQSRGESRAFHRATHDIGTCQEDLLRKTLRNNAACDYGQRFGFGTIGSLKEYQDRVPICDYGTLRPEIDAIASGRPGVLTTEPVLMMEPTGGSSGGTKLIPYTATLRRQFQRAIAAWMHDVLSRYPGVRGGRSYWSISPAVQRPPRTPGGVRVGFDSDTEYLAGWQQWAMRRLVAVPSAVAKQRNIENFQYATLASLVAAGDLSLISVWSPTFLTGLIRRLPEWWERILSDLEAGDWSWPAPDAVDRSHPFPPLKLPRRAAMLRDVFTNHELPAEQLARVWPNLALVSAWGDAAAELFVPALRGLFPTVPIQPKGLLATEGVISFPWNESVAPALAVCSHVFEFVPVESLPDVGQPPRWSWELETGVSYRVLLTTGGGLYRYDLGDLVEVTGFRQRCPLLKFVGRGTVGSDLVGEKLHEDHVRRAVREGCRELGMEPHFALVVPITQQSPGYRALLVCNFRADTPASQSSIEARLATAIERGLLENSQYRYATQLGQLRPLEVRLLKASAESAWSVYEAECRRRGQKSGDIKPTTLVQGADWDGLLDLLEPQHATSGVKSDIH